MPQLTPEQDRLRVLADRLARWARGDAASPDVSDGVLELVVEAPEAIDWLADPATGLVGPSSVVFAGASRLPDGPGQWVQITGGAGFAGDELGLDRDLYVQTVDYASVRYLSVVGPTVVRITNDDDALDLAADVEHAQRTGEFPEALLHPFVELGDRCALGSACRAAELTRLYVGSDELVRTTPFGRVLGRAGDAAAGLRAAAREGCPCCETPVDGVPAFLAALDAVRILSVREQTAWRVSGYGFALLDGSAARRQDLLVLTDGSSYVLYDAGARRAFRVGREAAEATEAILASPDAEHAADALRAGGRPAIQAREVEGLRAEFARRGVELAFAA